MNKEFIDGFGFGVAFVPVIFWYTIITLHKYREQQNKPVNVPLIMLFFDALGVLIILINHYCR